MRPRLAEMPTGAGGGVKRKVDAGSRERRWFVLERPRHEGGGGEGREGFTQVYCKVTLFYSCGPQELSKLLLVQLAWAPRHPAAAWQRRAVAH